MASALPNTQHDFDQTVRALRAQIDERLNEWLPQTPPSDVLGTAMREGTLASGKRTRPLLLMLALKDLQDEPAVAVGLDLACALEMVHAASLFLDDMPCMDNAELRRGRPTIHRQYGEDAAVLGSVALLSHAFSIVASPQDIAADIRNQLVRLLAQATGSQGLSRGQFHDLREGKQARPLEAITQTNCLKTCPLFTAAVEFAALLAGASATRTYHLSGFANELGQAFQLLDDLADQLSPQQIGKDAGKDAGKSTVVALLGRDAASQRIEDHLACAENHLIAAGIGDGHLARFIEYFCARPR
ncbi:geranylgeranyl pyrophosphate synthase [Stutzerimonas stutzeri]|uniref:Geranylgeranyl pyrophosphate synthase n=1 Tax=Stutzerimonas stutzeri TaxID=316 RepID=W8RYC8_STUST|nr:polyprenyl synthetase family protein [Stutzerimonas stutzeri]AHL77096.1 geranylgeranyl pyrophosphate synthase [Stutzerimonas stutzeri]